MVGLRLDTWLDGGDSGIVSGRAIVSVDLRPDGVSIVLVSAAPWRGVHPSVALRGAAARAARGTQTFHPRHHM